MIIKIRKQDLLKGTAVSDGWYGLEIRKSPEQPTKPKSGGDTLNFIYSFAILDENGKVNENLPELDHNFNTGALGMMRDFIAVAKGMTVKQLLDSIAAEGLDFDPERDTPVGLKLQGKVVNETFESRLISKIKAWLPYGVQPPF